ncbi:hypothetical protein R6Q59_032102 [Mikania micrantha]|uniref:C2H2-type domain-containing protein n=1 Tax=Mikania micrantha TaxID=192012 RepID=A0A5N6NQ16_9ASTR|nr:hypothetical protein E3N88_16828 [Mikania micrantha]
MWNPNSMMEEDESWEVKAFAEDTGNNATWPPRSYTCTFCRREFRSAQALGGHMNVHRRDRARLHQAHSLKNPNLSSSPASSLLIPADQELVADAGLCLLFSLPNPNRMFKPSSSSSHLLSVTPRPTAVNLMNLPAGVANPHSFNYNSLSNSSNIEASTSVDHKRNQRNSLENKKKKSDLVVEGIDLELRLGCSSSSGS